MRHPLINLTPEFYQIWLAEGVSFYGIKSSFFIPAYFSPLTPPLLYWMVFQSTFTPYEPNASLKSYDALTLFFRVYYTYQQEFCLFRERCWSSFFIIKLTVSAPEQNYYWSSVFSFSYWSVHAEILVRGLSAVYHQEVAHVMIMV